MSNEKASDKATSTIPAAASPATVVVPDAVPSVAHALAAAASIAAAAAAKAAAASTPVAPAAVVPAAVATAPATPAQPATAEASAQPAAAAPAADHHQAAETPVEVKRFYSAKNLGFYSTDVHAVIPDDAVELSHDEWAALMDAQTRGKQILPNGNGRPTAVAPQSNPAQQRAALLAQLDSLDAKSIRALREQALGIVPEKGQPSPADRLSSYNATMTDLRAQLQKLS